MIETEPTAIVLAAGEGRRLEPLTNRRPKPMMPVGDRPLLGHVVDALRAAGVRDVVFVVGYERDRIQTHFGDGEDWGVEVRYVKQETQLGTGHALLQAESAVDGQFLVLNGDRIIDPDGVEAVWDALDCHDAAMAVARSAEPERYGVVELDGDRVDRIVEKPRGEVPSNLINAGIYALDGGIFEVIRETPADVDGEQSLPAAIERLEGSVGAVRYDGRWLDVSYLWDLLAVTAEVLDRDGGENHGTVRAGAQVIGPAEIAETATVGANAVVGRGTTVGANARIGPNATVERSVLFPDATVGAGAVLRDCVVGANAAVGGNVTIAGGDATVIVDGEVHEDVALGGVVGDNSTVGGGAVLAPGTVIHDDATVQAGAVAQGTVEPNATVQRG